VVIRSAFERPAENETYSDRRFILWVGSFRSVKRPEMFVELARRLPQFKFVMIGGSASNQSAFYDDICRVANELTNLELTGSVMYGDIGRYFGEAFLFVNTSSSEGFPNTYLQSWCRGTPVLATFDPDGVIDKFGLGQHCPGIDELEMAVLRFMSDEDLRKSAARRGVEYVNEHHRPDVVAAEYDSLFVSLCK
ncbi:MAG TPA: glycosyltransferase family 4 protein, partial [Armatimonadota bacterium]|jgi:glycosyltransferase involved in cell wall biosynthesis